MGLYSTDDQDPVSKMSCDKKHIQVVILGASGDLNARKLIPAIYHSWQSGNLKKYHQFRIIGVARRPWNNDSFREHLKEKSPAAQEGSKDGSWDKFQGFIHYCRVHLDQPQDYEAMRKYLDELHSQVEVPLVRIFYLAVKPDLFLETVGNIKRVGLFDDGDRLCTRVVVEKPFGHDLLSSIELNKSLGTMLTERQLYRIDHYLGKETVQNILAFRFRNAMFEPMWNQKYVELVQITVAETVGMENGRGGYYDQAGALRDIIQNHALQLLALVAMEPPASLRADDIRNEKVKVLSSLRNMDELHDEDPETHVCRAQFEGYRDEKGVAEDSETETFLAARTYIDNWRWGGVPFILRTGKCMKERFTSITVQYHMPPHTLFGSYDECHLRPNHITLRIQPNEGIDIAFDVKEPGPGNSMKNAALSFNYSDAFNVPNPDAYQRLLEDVMAGDQSLFIRSDEVEASWKWADSVRRYMEKTPVQSYPKGSWGPKASNKLFRECEGRWVGN